METFNRIAPDVRLGQSVKVFGFANLYGCTVGDESDIGCFVEIQKNAIVGARCKISGHSFICEGVTIEDEVFIDHHVCFINDLFPRACRPDGTLQTDVDWKAVPNFGRTARYDWLSGGHSGRRHDRCRSHRRCRSGCDQERRARDHCGWESGPFPTRSGEGRGAVKVRVNLKGGDRFAQTRLGSKRGFLVARSRRFGTSERQQG